MKYILFVISSLIIAGAIYYVVGNSLENTGGGLVYALDDAYIHMALAKNSAAHGIFGMTKHEFTPSSSSPLWSVVEYLYFKYFGISEAGPLILNLIFAFAFLVAAYIIFSRRLESPFLVFIAVIAAFLVLPVASLVMIGMEHILHSLLYFLFLYFVVKSLLKEKKEKGYYFIAAAALAFLSCGARLESSFSVFLAGILFLFQKKPLKTIILWLSGAAPILIYGFIMLSKGWFILPTTVLLKSGADSILHPIGLIKKLFYKPLLEFGDSSAVLVLAIIAALFFILKLRENKRDFDFYFIILYVLSIIMHMQFSETGHLFRYESYFIAPGIYLLAVLTEKVLRGNYLSGVMADWKQIIAFALAYIIIASPLIVRGLESIKHTPIGAQNIYLQQIQMARFTEKYYNGHAVAMNDIGAINYYADIKCVDLYGLASKKVAEIKINGDFTTKEIGAILNENNVAFAVIYDSWFNNSGELPKEWRKAGEWRMFGNIVCGDDNVSFYAKEGPDFEILTQNLQDYSASLPGGVIETGYYKLVNK